MCFRTCSKFKFVGYAYFQLQFRLLYTISSTWFWVRPLWFSVNIVAKIAGGGRRSPRVSITLYEPCHVLVAWQTAPPCGTPPHMLNARIRLELGCCDMPPLSPHQLPSEDLDPVLCLLCWAGIEEECSVGSDEPGEGRGGGGGEGRGGEGRGVEGRGGEGRVYHKSIAKYW